jgi:glycosyltransferase involved in cell wall biosynthesis
MKICMLVHQNYYIDQRVIRYAEALVEQGHSVDVVCARERSQVRRKRVNGSIRVTPILIPHGNSGNALEFLLEYGLAFVCYFFVLSWQFIFRRYDVIHVHNMPDLLVFAALLPRICGAKVILDIHDPVPEFYQSKFKAKEEGKLVQLLRFEERCSIRFSHAVICANENFRDNIINRGTDPGKITVVRNFPDRKVYDREKFAVRKNENSQKFVLVYPGTIAPRYGLAIAIRAIEIIKDEYPMIELRIIGPDNAHKQSLKELVAALAIEKWVKILPPVSMDEVPAVLANADMGIYPAFPDAHMDIAIPTKVLEFTVMGLPVIASRLTVINQLFKNGRLFLFTPGDIDEFAEVIQQCLANRAQLYETVAINEANLLPEWKWELEKEKYLALLQDLSQR